MIELIFLVLGLALALAGIYWLTSTREFVAKAAATTGLIVSVEERTSTSDDRTVRTYAPVIRFKDAVGREVTFTSNFSATGMQRRVGQSVPVLYDPHNSAQARMGGGAPLYLGPAVLLVIGLAFAGFGGGSTVMKALSGSLNKPRGDVGALAGNWVNVDAQTSHITRVTIAARGVSVWGKCHPYDCDWGMPASYDSIDGANGTMSVTWAPSFARKNQQLTLLPDGRLKVVTFTHFVDRSKRQDRENTDYFARAK